MLASAIVRSQGFGQGLALHPLYGSICYLIESSLNLHTAPEVAAQANRRFDDGLLPAVEELFIVNEAILVSSDPAASMSRSRTRDFANLPPASPERDSSSNRLEGLGLIENSIRQVTRSGTAAAGGDRRT